MNEMKISANTTFKPMTVENLLSAQKIGTIATPDIQRPAGVWSTEQEALLADSLLRGWSVGVISLVKVGELELLVDGLQRLTALAHYTDFLADKMEAEQAEEYRLRAMEGVDPAVLAAAVDAHEQTANKQLALLDSVVMVSVTEAEDARDAAELFLRLNNGTPLSKIQRGTAGLDSAVLEWARGWADLLPEKVSGKIGRDEAALVLAACAANKQRMTTNGPAAVKFLATLTAGDLDNLPAVDKYKFAFAEYTAAMTTAGNTHMLTPQYMIPYALGSGDAEHTLTRDDWAAFIARGGLLAGELVRTLTPAKGKDNKQVSTHGAGGGLADDRMTFGSIDSDKSNAARATVARYSAVSLGDLYRRIKGERCPGDRVKGGKPAPATEEQKKAANIEETIKALEEASK